MAPCLATNGTRSHPFYSNQSQSSTWLATPCIMVHADRFLEISPEETHWPQRSEMFDSRVTRLSSRVGTLFVAPVQRVNQSQGAGAGCCYYCERLRGQETTLAHFITVCSPRRVLQKCSTLYPYEDIYVLPTKQTHAAIFCVSCDSVLRPVPERFVSFKSIEMLGVSKPLNVAVPHHTPRQTPEWGRHVQFHGPRRWWVVPGRFTDPPKKLMISFSIRHSGVSAWLRGRRPLFADKRSSLSPPLTFSIVGANGWCAVCLIGGESHIGRWRSTNANSKLLCIHYSQPKPTQ